MSRMTHSSVKSSWTHPDMKSGHWAFHLCSTGHWSPQLSMLRPSLLCPVAVIICIPYSNYNIGLPHIIKLISRYRMPTECMMQNTSWQPGSLYMTYEYGVATINRGSALAKLVFLSVSQSSLSKLS